jgi:hypothetical protein
MLPLHRMLSTHQRLLARTQAKLCSARFTCNFLIVRRLTVVAAALIIVTTQPLPQLIVDAETRIATILAQLTATLDDLQVPRLAADFMLKICIFTHLIT